MNSLFLMVDLILSILMEKQTKHNSSLPSSQTEKDETDQSQADAIFV